MSLKQARALSRWSYAQAKRECEARVVRWEYATFDRYSLEPHYFERHRFHRGDLLARPSKRAYANGFDAEGMLRIERSPVEFEGQYYETFYAPRDGGIARRHFDYSPEKRVINDAFFEVEDGRIVRCDTVYARGTRSAEIYHWDRRGRLASVDRTDARGKSTQVMVWDRRGLARVDFIEKGKKYVSWRRVEPKRDLVSLRPALERGLVRAIRKALAKEKSLQAAALWWCEDEWQHRFPPNLAVATEPDFDPSPVEWDGERDIPLDRTLDRMCEDASSDTWQNDRQDLADRIVRSVAKKLRIRAVLI